MKTAKITIILFAAAAAAILYLFANGGNTRGAGEAAARYIEMTAQGDYEAFVEGLAGAPGQSYDHVRRQEEDYLSMLRWNVGPAIHSKGGIHRVEVVSEKTLSDGRQAAVVLENIYNDAPAERIAVNLVWVDSRWKIDMEENWSMWDSPAVAAR